jgi:hypothetical protein
MGVVRLHPWWVPRLHAHLEAGFLEAELVLLLPVGEHALLILCRNQITKVSKARPGPPSQASARHSYPRQQAIC